MRGDVMDNNYNPPSINPAKRGSVAGTVDFIITKALQGVDTMLPAKVIAYDVTSNRASLQILINVVTTKDEQVARAPVASVPVYQPSAGGFIVRLPIVPGDTGWIKANDRDISLFLQALQQSPPNTARLHSFSDGVFFPDAMNKDVVIADADKNALILQTVDGTTKMVMSTDTIAFTSTHLTHNGKNIGSTHVHINGGGTGNSGVPA